MNDQIIHESNLSSLSNSYLIYDDLPDGFVDGIHHEKTMIMDDTILNNHIISNIDVLFQSNSHPNLDWQCMST